MARRGTISALLGSGLVAITALGGVGGYGVGLLTTSDRSDAATGTAAPLGSVRPPTPAPSTSPTPTTKPREVEPDNTPALKAGKLRFTTRDFTVRYVYKSHVQVRVPATWDMTQPDPPRIARFTDPTGKRWIRVEAGFTISRPPAASMGARIRQLEALPADQMLKIISRTVEDNYATLVYTYVPPAELAPIATLRSVIVRWVADASGNCAVEMSTTGLPQDKEALELVIDKASSSVIREDSPLPDSNSEKPN